VCVCVCGGAGGGGCIDNAAHDVDDRRMTRLVGLATRFATQKYHVSCLRCNKAGQRRIGSRQAYTRGTIDEEKEEELRTVDVVGGMVGVRLGITCSGPGEIGRTSCIMLLAIAISCG
jgi:hypothetical protein